ncbi:MAG: transcription elongation factor GreA [Proteobacteria bacterium]|nr:transcription elongation factor GreA [Pseudomonadota bacterium]
MERFPITAEGAVRMQEELRTLKSVERPSIIKAIAAAREHGDLKENAEYHAAREQQSFVEGRIIELEDKSSRMDIIDILSLKGRQIKFGATVTMIDEETEEKSTFQIVGEYEADPAEGKISVTSPIARALIGKSVDDSVEVITPRGQKDYEILKVDFK